MKGIYKEGTLNAVKNKLKDEASSLCTEQQQTDFF